jgi:hypothetical protein
LDSTYTGSAVEVYNGSSYADIGFNVFGELDTVALAAHCGSNDGFVSKWYDQSGNSNDAVQTATGNMPKIYDGTTGVVTDANGKAAVSFLNQFIDAPALGGAAFTHFVYHTNSSAVARIFGTFDRNDNSFLWDKVTSYTTFHRAASIDVTGLPSTLRKLVYVLMDTTNSEVAINGATATTGTLGPTSSRFTIGKRVSSYWSGLCSELIIYNSDQSSNRTNIEDNINTFYSIY